MEVGLVYWYMHVSPVTFRASYIVDWFMQRLIADLSEGLIDSCSGSWRITPVLIAKVVNQVLFTQKHATVKSSESYANYRGIVLVTVRYN